MAKCFTQKTGLTLAIDSKYYNNLSAAGNSLPYTFGIEAGLNRKLAFNEACYRDNLHSIWANRELYRNGNTAEEFYGILEKNMRPVYDSAKRQGYDVWEVIKF